MRKETLNAENGIVVHGCEQVKLEGKVRLLGGSGKAIQPSLV